MRMMKVEELGRELDAVLQGEDPILVTLEGMAIGFILPVASSKGQELLAAYRAELYESFIGNGSSGQTDISVEHDRYLYILRAVLFGLPRC